MSKIDWNKVSNFSACEFPEDPNLYADPELMYTLQNIRVSYNERIFPSPASGALARFNGSKTSQHYVGENTNIVRKSTAIDVFPEGIPFMFFYNLLRFKNINGIGIYLDTNGVDGKPWVMFHFDLRKEGFKTLPLIWVSKKVKGTQKYFYPNNDKSVCGLLNDSKFFTPRYK